MTEGFLQAVQSDADLSVKIMINNMEKGFSPNGMEMNAKSIKLDEVATDGVVAD